MHISLYYLPLLVLHGHLSNLVGPHGRVLKEKGKHPIVFDLMNLPRDFCGNLADHNDLVHRGMDPKNEGRFPDGSEGPGPTPLHFPLHILNFRVENISERERVGLR